MKTKNVMKWAGLFVGALFMLTTVPTNAIDTIEQTQHQQGGYILEEPYSFPPQLPPGTSSLSCITKRRGIDPWHMCIFDVGFSVWSMRLRDGPAHNLHIIGTISVIWHKGETPQIIPYPKFVPWDSYVFGGFDIYRVDQFRFPQSFYTATVSGYIYKDMGAPEWKSKDLTGYNYYLENDLLQNPIELEQVALEGYTAQ